MSRIVYTYHSLDCLETHPKYNEFSKYPHITATADLAKAVNNRYKDSIHSVTHIQSIIHQMAPYWSSRETLLEQQINISRVIRDVDIKDDESLLLESFQKNKSSVLNAIRLLVEASVYPDEISISCPEESLFYRIWWGMEDSDQSIARFRKEFDKAEDKPAYFKTKSKSFDFDFDFDTIVLHGFYFITPIQERLFDILEANGKNLVFLSHIDDYSSPVNEIWKKTFSEKDGFPSESKWVSSPGSNGNNSYFSGIFQGKRSSIKPTNIHLLKYQNENEFINDFKRLIDDNYLIFGTDIKKSEELLKPYFPDFFKTRHLLAYPIGQYIYCLHSMWNSRNEQLEFSIDDLITCFSSGWLEYHGEKATDYVGDLQRLKVYTSDCKTVEEWQNRLQLLTNTINNVSESFEKHLSEVPDESFRWHRIMSNPLLNFSFFSIDIKKVEVINGFITSIINTANMLFGDGSELSLLEHFNKIKDILHNHDDANLLKEEQAILDEISERLFIDDNNITTCLPGDLSDAIMIIIGSGSVDEDADEINGDYTNQLIKPLYQSETAVLFSNKKIHLCLSDESRLPGQKQKYPWPITFEMLSNLNMANPEKYYRYVADMINVVENSALAKRYLFYSLLENSDVEISWIEEEDEKKVNPSPYINLLSGLYDIHIDDYRESNAPGRWIPYKPLEPSGAILDSDIAEVSLDTALCPWRRAYGYQLLDHPYYSTDFHISFALSRMIGVFSKLTNEKKEKVAKQIFEIFPFLNRISMQQSVDYAGGFFTGDTDSLDNISYPEDRLKIHMLQKSIYNKALQLRDIDKNAPSDLDDKTCMYCPFKDDCPHSIL